MARGSSFARDWQLIKLSRHTKRHDISAPLLQRLLDGAPATVKASIAAAATRLGKEEGKELLARTPAAMDRAALAGSVLMMWGIAFAQETAEGGGIRIQVRKDDEALASIHPDPRIAVPYLAGYLSALAPRGGVRDDAEHLTAEFRKSR